MRAIDIARRMAELGQLKEAGEAYALALMKQLDEMNALETMECSIWLLQSSSEQYQVIYLGLLKVMQDGGELGEEAFRILTGAFYEPNEREMRGRYNRNCKLLSRYPYLFRKDFLAFESLPVRFYPVSDNVWFPYTVEARKFGGSFRPMDSEISHNFFSDLEKPILATEIFSQYELQYLVDNVRPSEYVAKENHIYLYYPDWGRFCAFLQVLNMRPLLESKKVVFLIGDEIKQYPINFKERFGVDYSKRKMRPVGVGEIKRIIWHMQLSAHNGGDYVNEILDCHPNLLYYTSVEMKSLNDTISKLRDAFNNAGSVRIIQDALAEYKRPDIVAEVYWKRDRNDKDLMVLWYLLQEDWNQKLDHNARITPALYFQPHFRNIEYNFYQDESGGISLADLEIRKLEQSDLIRSFPYIKAFFPVRRFTTSYAATVRYSRQYSDEEADYVKAGVDGHWNRIVTDLISIRVRDRAYLTDTDDRLYRDCAALRFEDAKLNPKAVFTALAAFLDLPYTNSMMECTEQGIPTPMGFNTKPVYNTYDDFANVAERCFIEYFFQDAYRYYGYDFHYYDGKQKDETWVINLISGFTCIDKQIEETAIRTQKDWKKSKNSTPEEDEEYRKKLLTERMETNKTNRLLTAKQLMQVRQFINDKGHVVHPTRLLKLDPTLLEQPLYH